MWLIEKTLEKVQVILPFLMSRGIATPTPRSTKLSSLVVEEGSVVSDVPKETKTKKKRTVEGTKKKTKSKAANKKNLKSPKPKSKISIEPRKPLLLKDDGCYEVQGFEAAKAFDPTPANVTTISARLNNAKEPEPLSCDMTPRRRKIDELFAIVVPLQIQVKQLTSTLIGLRKEMNKVIFYSQSRIKSCLSSKLMIN